jgi:hypothetical protein
MAKTITISLDDAILIAGGCLPRNERKLRDKYGGPLVAAITRFKAAVVAGNLAAHAPPDAYRNPAVAAWQAAAPTRKERALAIDVARQALKAVRNPCEDGPGAHPWVYFAEETRSWWAITSDAMVQLADMLEAAKVGGARAAHPRAIIDAWAESDDSAVELDRAMQRRLDRAHGTESGGTR